MLSKVRPFFTILKRAFFLHRLDDAEGLVISGLPSIILGAIVLAIVTCNLIGLVTAPQQAFQRMLTIFIVDTIFLLMILAIQRFSSQTMKRWFQKAKTELAERIRIEQALRESEARYHALFENLFDGLLMSEPNGTIYAANAQACQLLGMTEAEIIRAGRNGIVVADEKLDRILLERQQHGQVLAELTYRRKDGSTFPVEMSSRIYQDGDGNLKTSVVFRDITYRKASEEALRISEEKFSSAFYQSPALLSIHRLNGAQVVEMNQAFLDNLGFTREEVLNHTVLQLGIWENLDDRAHYLDLIHQGVRRITVPESRWRTKNGSFILLQGSFNIIQIDGEDYLLSVMENITEQKRAENALLEAQALLRAIVDSTSDMIWAVDPNEFRITMYNRGLADYYRENIKIEVAIGKTPQELLRTEEQVQSWIGFYQRALREGPYAIEYEVTARNIILQLNLNLIEHNGKVVGISVFGRDITAQKAAQKQLATSVQQLHALSAHLQTIREEERAYIAREIHDELGQALTGIKMDIYWLKNRLEKQEGYCVPKPVSDRLADLLLETDQTIDSVRRIATDLRPSVLDTLGLLAAIEWLAGDFQARSGIPCVFQTPLKSLNIPTDFSTALFRICQEALTNVARHAQARRVIIQLQVQDADLVLSVEDNGKGINEEEIYRPGSLGILGMKERAFSFQGKLDFAKTANGGTRVIACFPNPPIASARQ